MTQNTNIQIRRSNCKEFVAMFRILYNDTYLLFGIGDMLSPQSISADFQEKYQETTMLHCNIEW